MGVKRTFPAGARHASLGGALTGRRQLGSPGRTATPLYHQMYLVLREMMRSGDLEPQEPLPGEHQLASRFGVSRVTVRRTLKQMELEGLIVRRRGVGTFPSTQHRAMEHRYNIGGLTDSRVGAGGDARITTLSAGMTVAPAHVAALFASGTEPVLRIQRQRAVGEGEPFTLLTTWVPPAHAHLISRRQLRSAQTLRVLEDAGVEIIRAEQTVTARMADELTAGLLHVPVGSPLLAMATFFTGGQAAPVALLEALYRPDRYEYRLTMRRRGTGPQRRWQLVD